MLIRHTYLFMPIRRLSACERLQPTVDVAKAEKAKFENKARMTGYALNIAIFPHRNRPSNSFKDKLNIYYILQSLVQKLTKATRNYCGSLCVRRYWSVHETYWSLNRTTIQRIFMFSPKLQRQQVNFKDNNRVLLTSA